MTLIVNLFGEIYGVSIVRKPDFEHLNLPEGFDDDNSFDKSGFIPEMDFSHFFQRIDFDRSLNNFFESPELHPEPSIREERVGKKVHNLINVTII